MHLAPAAQVLDKGLLFMLSVRIVYILYVYCIEIAQCAQ
jgi:hypothetical protein